MLPSLTELCWAMTRHSRFVVEDLENIGAHYALTLAQWRRRFERQREALAALGFDAVFQRKWRYYFSYCEAGFAARTLNDLQLVLARPGDLDTSGPRCHFAQRMPTVR
jgi:cyclopropane-fatty-acyl-phospholipid synthase